MYTVRHVTRGAKMAPKAKKKAAALAAAPLKAQGNGITKRTPTSAFDGAAGKDTYEPEAVKATRLAKGVTQFLVKWVGYEVKDNTWEPIENLAGCEDMIVAFKVAAFYVNELSFAAFNTD